MLWHHLFFFTDGDSENFESLMIPLIENLMISFYNKASLNCEESVTRVRLPVLV